MGLKKFIEDIEPHFEKGGKHEKWFALYEAVATGLFTPGYVNKGNDHCMVSSIPSNVFWYV